MKHLTHASLFSGIGGAEIAADWAGWQNLFHCEINPFCRRVLEYHYPNSESYDDITKTDFTPWRGKVTVLTGGFPCQPFSLAGRRKGADDDRYLWPQMLRAIREIQPAWVVGENVNGIRSMVQSREEAEMASGGMLFRENHLIRARERFTFEEVCGSLEREGYSVQAFVIPACAVGAPHRRDRVWFVANAGVNRCRQRTDKPFPVPEATPRPTLAKAARENLLPTPTVMEDRRKPNGSARDRKLMTNLNPFSVAELLLTPQASDGLRSGMRMETLVKAKENGDLAQQVAHRIGGGSSRLSPLFVEEMMGFPKGWTLSPFLNGEWKA